jgi:hypothetical protein
MIVGMCIQVHRNDTSKERWHMAQELERGECLDSCHRHAS